MTVIFEDVKLTAAYIDAMERKFVLRRKNDEARTAEYEETP